MIRRFTWRGRMRLLCACLAVICAIAGISRAETSKGPYAGGILGAVFPRDATVDDDFGNHFEASLDHGVTVGGLGGYDFGRYRVDGHVRYLYAKIDRFELPGGSLSVRGDLQQAAVLFNGWIDFENGSPITPYVGGGLGAAQIRASDIRGGGNLIYAADTTAVFAYQAGAGITFAPAGNARIDVGYSYFATSDPDFESATAEFHGGVATIAFRYLIETD